VTDVMVERAMRAMYDAEPSFESIDEGRRPRSYEETYGCAPLENTEDATEMRIALEAALA
jgi:hypothetical protein